MTNRINQNINGMVVVNKKRDLTSHDVVNKLRQVYKIKRIGHTGTLDPLAKGVLPVCIGKCTRLSSILSSKNKTYECTILLGVATDTGDIKGKIIKRININESFYKIINNRFRSILNSFKGEYIQKVPLYSSVKIAGKKLYEYARSNQKISLPSRKVFVNNIEYMQGSFRYSDRKIYFSFTVSCSKGTYIRSLCEDIGKSLGIPATMQSLTRILVGNISIDHSYSLDYIEKNPLKCIIPVDKINLHLPKLYLSNDIINTLKQGQKLYKNILKENYNEIFAVYSEDFKLIAIFDKSDKEYYKNLITFN